MRILVADDDASTRHLLASILRRWGYNVVVALDGTQAREVLESESAPAIALLDWMMPGIDGPELCQRVRARQGRDYTYLILLSARDSKQDTAAGLDSGADDYVTKPPDLAELRSRIRVGERVVGLQRSLAEANRQLTHLATVDSLTGLPNRRTILERLAVELRRCRRFGRPLSIVILDIDRFKAVNDRYGHQAGDQVLAELARRLTMSCRCYDLVARYGGEEFLVVVPEAGAEAGRAAAERFRLEVAEPLFRLDSGIELAVTASFGVATATLETDELPDHLIGAADRAMYQAKAEGRNCVCVAAPLVESAS